ncbi:MAG TPA: hypothetical protein VHW24_05230, partial [Bryobacteraceae bacterium]|nr:hypothetical protein [Bryobacteraceae bacterium]
KGLVNQVLVKIYGSAGDWSPRDWGVFGHGEAIVFSGTNIKPAVLAATGSADEAIAAKRRILGNQQDGAGAAEF